MRYFSKKMHKNSFVVHIMVQNFIKMHHSRKVKDERFYLSIQENSTLVKSLQSTLCGKSKVAKPRHFVLFSKRSKQVFLKETQMTISK